MLITDDAGFAVEIRRAPTRRVGQRWLFLDERPHIAREDAIAGWRIWWLLADQDHWGMADAELATLSNGRRTWVASPATCNPDATLGDDGHGHRRLTRAQQSHPNHQAPFGPCTCGYCLVLRLDHLVGAASASGHTLNARASQRIDDLQNMPVIAQCYGWGRCASGMPYDPRWTARVQHLLIKAVILPRAINPVWEQQLRDSGNLPILGKANFNTLRQE